MNELEERVKLLERDVLSRDIRVAGHIAKIYDALVEVYESFGMQRSTSNMEQRVALICSVVALSVALLALFR